MGIRQTSDPGTKSLRVNYPIWSRNVVAGAKISVLATSPRNSNWFEFVGQVPGTCPINHAWSLRVKCSGDMSLRPNENISSDRLLFYQLAWRINLVFVCIGGLDRTVAVSAI